MLANPKEMVDKGFIKNITNLELQCQPNALDFTVNSIQSIDLTAKNGNIVFIGESEKMMAQQTPLFPDNSACYSLKAGNQYDISSKMYVEVPEGYAAVLVLRSTFVRNGCILASGLYDSGFKGNIGAVLHVTRDMLIEDGVRIGQIMFVESQSAGVYAGGYNTVDGQHWKDKAG